MSLKVWLPLNGSLKQQGCSNVTVTNNGATVNSAGKIGSCYSFDGSDDYISLSGTDLYNIFTGGSQQFSICFWIYHADSTRAIIFGDYGLSGAINFNLELSTSHQVRFYWAASPDKIFSAATNVAAAAWSHITITYNGNAVEIYKDGIKSTDKYSGTLATKNKTSGVFYLGRDSRTGTTVLNGRLNDFRIYDHCLSAAEVHEISQGLVLHYKLDDVSHNIIDSSGYGNNATSNGSQPITIDIDTPKYSYSTHFISGSRIMTPKSASLFMPKDQITVSIWYKSSGATNRFLSCTEGGGFNFEVNSSVASFPFYIQGKGYGRVNATINFQSDNQWHMLTATYDGTTAKIYREGILDNSTTITSGWENIPLSYNGSTPFVLGAEAQTISSPIAGTYVGNLSDCRVYCTALSAEDILALYHTSAKVDNKQNLHSFEFIEDQSKISITKHGQTKCDEFEETINTKFRKDKIIETAELIEF